jgi:hypothetical protein
MEIFHLSMARHLLVEEQANIVQHEISEFGSIPVVEHILGLVCPACKAFSGYVCLVSV